MMPLLADAQVSNDLVKIGVLTDLSGPGSTPTGQGSVVAAQMAVDDFGGKVLGKRIVVISGNHQIKPDIGAAIARRWYDVEQVDLIVDVPVSSIGLAVQNVAKQQKKMMITHSTGATDFHGKFCSPYTMLGIRYARARGRNSAGGRKAWWRHMVLSNSRLCFRAFARAASLRSHPGEWWKSTRCGKASICHPGPFLVYPAGAGIQSENHRHCQWSARQHKCN
jgi:hypothetical protein